MFYRSQLASCQLGVCLLALWCNACFLRHSHAEEQRVPFVKLGISDRHLTLATCLPPGRTEFNAVDEQGLQLDGYVFVQQLAQGHTRLRTFQLHGRKATEMKALDKSPHEVGEFSIVLQASTALDHYVIRVRAAYADKNGDPVVDEARLGRTCCGYYVVASHLGKARPVGRAPVFTELTVKCADTYRRFEEMADICCRPGFEFVPASDTPAVKSEFIAAHWIGDVLFSRK